MTIANVTLNNTFDEWRSVTNQLINFVNEVDSGNLTKFYSNSAVLTVTENVARNGKNFITLNVSSDVLDTSTLNVATANAINIVFSSVSNSEARITLLYNNANVINSIANAAIIQANTARVHANAAHASANAGLLQANTARVHANVGFEQANTARVHANTAHASANAGLLQANTARVHANVGFEQANTARVHANVGFDQANTARVHANTAHASANAGLVQANTARDHANAGILQANTARVHANAGFEQANTARVHANISFEQANTGRIHANAGFLQANTARDRANAAYDLAATVGGSTAPIIEANKAGFDTANAAFDQANTARVHANVGFEQANTARVHANAGFEQANTARVHANGAFATANSAITQIAPSFVQANTARVHANAAFATANSAIIQIGPAFDQANTARVHANTGHASANAGFEQANTARVHANAAFATANSAITQIGPAFVQANTARDHANTAHASANAGLVQANTGRIHANNAFERANAALPNTSGVSFVGNIQIPTGNLTLGSGTNQGIRLHITHLNTVANVDPQIKIVNGSQFVNFNSNTSVGAFNDLMLDRDSSIIYSRGTSDDGANLIIGPWTDSSFGYKQDGAGRHGFNTMNPRFTLDANGSANISGSLLVGNQNVIPTLTASFVHANGAHASANAGLASANAGLLQANTARVHANVAFEQANTARVHANAAFATVNSAFGVANTALPNTSGTVYNGQLTIPVLIAGSPATDTARLRFGEAGNISYIQSGTQVAGSGRPIHFTTYSTATATMVVDAANGNVLIGRTDSTIGQSVRLDVNGGINAASFLTGTGQAVLNNSTTLISTGYTVTTFNAGSNIAVHLTWQPNAANGNYQVVAANGSVNISTPPANCAIDILFINASNRNPGAVTFSGYNVSATPGVAYATTANNRYILSIREIDNVATYSWYPLQ